MAFNPRRNTNGYVAWARRVNSRWIVHDDLARHATAFLDHLEQRDAPRLERACQRARELTRSGDVAEDPKPRFYGGLFSLATPEEKARFLRAHPFLQAVLAPERDAMPAELQTAGTGTQEKIRALREVMSQPPEEEDSKGSS